MTNTTANEKSLLELQTELRRLEKRAEYNPDLCYTKQIANVQKQIDDSETQSGKQYRIM